MAEIIKFNSKPKKPSKIKPERVPQVVKFSIGTEGKLIKLDISHQYMLLDIDTVTKLATALLVALENATNYKDKE